MKEMIEREKTHEMFVKLADDYNEAVEQGYGDEYMNALVMLMAGVFAAQETREATLRIAMAFTRALLKATKELREMNEAADAPGEGGVESQANITGSFDA